MNCFTLSTPQHNIEKMGFLLPLITVFPASIKSNRKLTDGCTAPGVFELSIAGQSSNEGYLIYIVGHIKNSTSLFFFFDEKIFEQRIGKPQFFFHFVGTLWIHFEFKIDIVPFGSLFNFIGKVANTKIFLLSDFSFAFLQEFFYLFFTSRSLIFLGAEDCSEFVLTHVASLRTF